MIEITPDLLIDPKCIEFSFTRSSGPGGQNINKVSSAVHLRFDAAKCSTIDKIVFKRLQEIAGSKMSQSGILSIDARRFSSQLRNRTDAMERLVKLLKKSLEKPKYRRKTKPTQAAQLRRLESKKHRSHIKKQRRSIDTKGL